MSADRNEVRAEGFRPHGDLAEALDRVHVDVPRGTGPFQGLRGGLHRHDAPHFVIDEHETHENGLVIDRFVDRLFGDLTGFIDRKPDDVEAFVLKALHAPLDARVFDRGRHDPVAAALQRFDGAEHGDVVALRAAAGEVHFLLPAAEGARQRPARVLELPVRGVSDDVQGGGVAPGLRHGARDRLHCLRQRLRRRTVVKISLHDRTSRKIDF